MPLALWSVKVTFGESCIVCMGKVVWRVNYSYLYEYVAYESHIFYFISFICHLGMDHPNYFTSLLVNLTSLFGGSTVHIQTKSNYNFYLIKTI